VLVALGVPNVSMAQSEDAFHRLTLSTGAGLTTIAGKLAGKLDRGFNVQLNGGYFFNRYIGITGNFMFSGLGITRSALDNLSVPDGSARMYALTADPTVRLPLGRGFTAYALAGGGYLRRTVEFTQPSLAQTFIFDPWWGYFGPALVPVDVVLGTSVRNSGAFNVGGGLNMPLPRTAAKLFLEARYFKGFTSNTNTAAVPITFGVRW
jgi:opacity protein-like surface antigen